MTSHMTDQESHMTSTMTDQESHTTSHMTDQESHTTSHMTDQESHMTSHMTDKESHMTSTMTDQESHMTSEDKDIHCATKGDPLITLIDESRSYHVAAENGHMVGTGDHMTDRKCHMITKSHEITTSLGDHIVSQDGHMTTGTGHISSRQEDTATESIDLVNKMSNGEESDNASCHVMVKGGCETGENDHMTTEEDSMATKGCRTTTRSQSSVSTATNMMEGSFMVNRKVDAVNSIYKRLKSSTYEKLTFQDLQNIFPLVSLYLCVRKCLIMHCNITRKFKIFYYLRIYLVIIALFFKT